MSSEQNKKSGLAETAEQANNVAEQAQEVADKLQQVVENTAQQGEQNTERGSGSQPQSLVESPDPPSSPRLPGDPSTTRPDY